MGETSAPQLGFRSDLRSYILGGEFNATGRRANRPGIPPSIAPRICHDWNEVRLSSSISAFCGSRPGEHRTGRSEPDAIGFAHCNRDAHGHADTYLDAYGDTHVDTYRHTDPFGDAHNIRNTHGYAYSFGNAHRDGDAHGHTDAHGHAYTFGDAHRDGDTHGHADTHGNADSDSDSHPHGDANRDTGRRDRPLPLLQGEDCAGFRTLRQGRNRTGRQAEGSVL